MRIIPKKNYIIFSILIVFTILLVLYLSNLYMSKSRNTTLFYNYSNKITQNEFKQYVTENNTSIIYVSNKFNSNYKDIEEELMNKIELNNLKNELVYIDVSKLDKNFKKEIKKYGIDINKYPILIFIKDNKISNYIYISEKINIDSVMEGYLND
ncbi:MAG: hypothetical protein Q4E75_03605 [bacterium]|nr:hypothetical protein [bacterium]